MTDEFPTTDDGFVIASLESMEHYQSIEHKGRLVAWSPFDGEQFSATPGDYFTADSGEALIDGRGEPMVLAYVMPEQVEPITVGEPDDAPAPSLKDAQILAVLRESMRQGVDDETLGAITRKFVTAQVEAEQYVYWFSVYEGRQDPVAGPERLPRGEALGWLAHRLRDLAGGSTVAPPRGWSEWGAYASDRLTRAAKTPGRFLRVPALDAGEGRPEVGCWVWVGYPGS